jgi:hypothetical protein
VPTRHGAHRIPGQLGVEVGVDVDEAGGDQSARRVVGLRGGARAFADDAVADDADIGAVRVGVP